jgi:hypothetical protein
VAVRCYLRSGLSYPDVEELPAEQGVEVDHLTVYRWGQRFTPLLAVAARAVSARGRGGLIRRRDVREGRQAVAVTGVKTPIDKGRNTGTPGCRARQASGPDQEAAKEMLLQHGCLSLGLQSQNRQLVDDPSAGAPPMRSL